jgi:hypothetical protein
MSRHPLAGVLILLATSAVVVSAQSRTPPRKPAAPAPTQKTVAAAVDCPSPLGTGVTTHLSFCDVTTGRDPAQGIRIPIPPHRGPVTLTFSLHNRETYSEEQVKANRAWARYTATIGVLTMDNTLISRAVVQSEFRTAADLLDHISGGAGPDGVKAVAPTGSESIKITIPERENEVSILGEKLTVERVDNTATYSSPGRAIAIISDVMLSYRPGPAPRPTAKPVGKTGK